MSFKKRNKITVETIPTTIEEAMQVLDIYVSEEDKIWLANEPNSAIKVHHTLGRWMRNRWGLWLEEPNELELKRYFLNQGIKHPDDMSYKITEEYVKHLKEHGYDELGYKELECTCTPPTK